jgi:hypothetical protein
MKNLEIETEGGKRRLAISFHGMDELLLLLPFAYEFACGCEGELSVALPGKDYPGIFRITQQGNRSAVSNVHSTLIDMLHHEKLPLHYYRIVNEWEMLRTVDWHAQRQKVASAQYQD